MPSDEKTWSAVDAYFEAALVRPDDAFTFALSESRTAGLPPHHVSATQGALLELLVRSIGAQRVLELGTLGGYSTLWLARGVGEVGRVITLELDAHRVDVARRVLAHGGVLTQVQVIHGPALASLDAMLEKKVAPFDFVFIDADKPNNPAYLERCLQLTRPGSLIVADNAVRGGAVADASSSDANVRGVRAFIELVGKEPRLQATAIQTVGNKGYDGFVLARVR